MNLINRDQLIGVIESHLVTLPDGEGNPATAIIQQLISDIRNQPVIDTETMRRQLAAYEDAVNKLMAIINQRWIPVAKKLPEDLKPVLVWYEYFHYTPEKVLPEYGIGWYFSNTKTWGGDAGCGSQVRVIAWQPLPEPYEEKEE